MLGEKLWVDLAVPTGKKIWPDVRGQGDPCLEWGLERTALPWQWVLAQEMLWKPEES